MIVSSLFTILLIMLIYSSEIDFSIHYFIPYFIPFALGAVLVIIPLWLKPDTTVERSESFLIVGLVLFDDVAVLYLFDLGGEWLFAPIFAGFMFLFSWCISIATNDNADFGVVDQSDNILLSSAVRLGNKDMVEMLCSKGADVNARNRNNFTPLRSAIMGKNIDIANILVSNGADLLPKIFYDESKPHLQKFYKISRKESEPSKSFKSVSKSELFPELPLSNQYLFCMEEPIKDRNLANISEVGLSICANIKEWEISNSSKWPSYAVSELEDLTSAFLRMKKAAPIEFRPIVDTDKISNMMNKYMLELKYNKAVFNKFFHKEYTLYYMIIDFGNTIGCGGTLQTALECSGLINQGTHLKTNL